MRHGSQNTGLRAAAATRPRAVIETRPMCLTCRRAGASCLCSEITRLAPRTKFVFLTHPKEARKVKNGTGRLAHLSLVGSELLVGIDFSQHPRVLALLADPACECRVLYPAPPGRAARAAEAPPALATPVLFVLDATWPLAKKMMRQSTNLHALPRVSIAVSQPSAFRIKRQPDPRCLATIEAVDRTLQALAAAGAEAYGAEDSARLLRPFEVLNAMSLAHARAPGAKAYRGTGRPRGREARAQRRTSKRSPRKVMFQG